MGKGPHLNVDATPLMHRLPAVWRMRARLPQPAALRFIVMLRQPEKRSASHFQMLQKLSRRGEEWARLYVQVPHWTEREPTPTSTCEMLRPPDAIIPPRSPPPSAPSRLIPAHPRSSSLTTSFPPSPRPSPPASFAQNHTIDSKLRHEAHAIGTCIRARMGPNAAVGKLPPKTWHDCVAVACSFHACVVGQSIYVPQLKAWINTFAARQMLVLTLDGFATSTRGVLAKVSTFLGVRAFPRLVLNWKWNWNTNARKKRLGEASNATLDELRTFFAPYNDALADFLRHRRQPQAAQAVERWKSS